MVTLCCRESQVKIAEEQCKSDLSATCNMPCPSWPIPRHGPGPSVFIVSYALPPVPEDQKISSTILTNKEFPAESSEQASGH